MSLSPVAVEGLCAAGSGQQGALSVGPHGSVGGLGLWDGLWGLELQAERGDLLTTLFISGTKRH